VEPGRTTTPVRIELCPRPESSAQQFGPNSQASPAVWIAGKGQRTHWAQPSAESGLAEEARATAALIQHHLRLPIILILAFHSWAVRSSKAVWARKGGSEPELLEPNKEKQIGMHFPPC
jgi:hypothetical protein